MKYKALVTKQVELLIDRMENLKNAVDGNKLTREELMRQFDTLGKDLTRILDEVNNEDNPPLNFQ